MASDTFNLGHQIEVVVNGQSRGRKDANGKLLGAFLKEQAAQYGVRTFSAYVDNRKVTTGDSASPLDNVERIEIVAKDQRGAKTTKKSKKAKKS